MTTCGAHSSYKCGTSPTKVVCDTIPYMTTPTGRTTPYLLYLHCFHPPLHIIKLKPNICQVCACVRQDLGHRTHAKRRQTQKTRDRLEEKRAKQNTHTHKTHHITTLCPSSSPLSLPPFRVPNSAPCATLLRCKGGRD